MKTIFPISVGIVLTLIGFGSYLISGAASMTALIPALFGLAFVALSFWSTDGYLRKGGLIGVMGVAALGLLGTLRIVPDLLALLSGAATGVSMIALASQAIMLALCIAVLAAGARALPGSTTGQTHPSAS